jgi:pimeloyl-ACP methyl ester carboxylesterase
MPVWLLTILIMLVTLLTGCDAVINYFAFHPDSQNVLATEQLPGGIEEFSVTTEDDVKLQGLYLPRAESDSVLIYFHGNAGNIYHRIPDLIKFRKAGVSVVGVGYRGYGNSEGSPDESGIYRDGEAVYRYVIDKLGYPESRIILFGRSIGTAVALHVAHQHTIGGLILVTPLTSGKAQAEASGLGFIAPIAGNSFDNVARIKQVNVPLLVIHGTEDRIIPFSMGREIYDSATGSKQFVKIEGAGHNNLQSSYGAYYWPPMVNFIERFGAGRGLN